MVHLFRVSQVVDIQAVDIQAASDSNNWSDLNDLNDLGEAGKG